MLGPTESSILRLTSSHNRFVGGQPPLQVDETITRQRLMDRLVDLLIQKAVAAEYWPEAYQRALEVLESLPLATNEFAIAAQRQENARRYAARGEFGAAAFELRQLRGALST